MPQIARRRMRSRKHALEPARDAGALSGQLGYSPFVTRRSVMVLAVPRPVRARRESSPASQLKRKPRPNGGLG